MQLSDWLEREKISRSEFARMVGVSPGAVTGWCEGAFWINKDKARRIFDATKGEVTPTDFMHVEAAAE